MAELTKGDWTRLAILCAWALTWTPIPAVALDKLLTDPWDVFASIATAGATLVALWFGSAEGRHRKQQEARAAGIYRWVFGAEIATLKTALSEIELTASLVESSKDGDGLTPDTKPYMESVAGLLELPTLGAHLDRLPDLPTSFAQPLGSLVWALPRPVSFGPSACRYAGNQYQETQTRDLDAET